MRKKNKRKLIIIIMLLIILLILLLYKLVFLKKEKEVTPEKVGVAQPIYIKDKESKLYPENIFAVVYKYKGKTDLVTVYNSLYKFKRYVELLSNETLLNNEQQIQQYYDNNNYYIKEYTGVTDVDSFKSLVKEVQKLSNSRKEFVKSTIDSSSIVEDDNGITCKLIFEYKDTKLNFKFTLLNSGTNSRNTYLYEAL